MTKQLKFRGYLLLTLAIVWSPLTQADKFYVNWKDVKLQAAQGVPAEIKHSYQIKGKLTLSKTKVTKSWFSSTSKNILLGSIWVSASGSWDQHKNTADERIILSGDQKGNISNILKCDKDPWINQRPGCVVISTKMSSEMDSISNWSEVLRKQLLPLTHRSVNLADASRLSKINTPPPPPPPPAGNSTKGKSFKKVKEPLVKRANIKSLSGKATIKQKTLIAPKIITTKPKASIKDSTLTVQEKSKLLKKKTKKIPKLKKIKPVINKPLPKPKKEDIEEDS